MPDEHSSEIVSHRIDERWTGFLWFSWLFIATFYCVGASVSVDWGNRSIPFLTALGTIRWQKFFEILHEGREVLIVYASLVICTAYTFRTKVKTRLFVMSLGFVFPFIFMGAYVEIFGLMAVAPISVLWMIGGIADGEFYIEDMPQYGAIGLWMWVSILFTGYQGYLILSRRYRLENALKSKA